MQIPYHLHPALSNSLEPDSGSSLPAAFFDVLAANGLYAPAVEAQRASCRALARRIDAGSERLGC